MSIPRTVRRRLADVDELGVVARRWDVDFRQIDRSSVERSLLQWVTATPQLARGAFSRPRMLEGSRRGLAGRDP
jgi:hypothetical protein